MNCCFSCIVEVNDSLAECHFGFSNKIKYVEREREGVLPVVNYCILIAVKMFRHQRDTSFTIPGHLLD